MSTAESTTKPVSTTTKSSSNKKEKKKPEPPGPFGMFILGGVGYYIVINIVLGVVSSLLSNDEASITNFENLFTSEDSSSRSLVNNIQFLARLVLVLKGLGIGSLILFLGSLFTLGGFILYCVLSAPLAEFGNLKHKPSYLILPLLGFPLGYFLLWPGVDAETGEKNVPSWLQWFFKDVSNYGYVMCLLLFALTMSLYQLGNKEDKKRAAEKLKKENLSSAAEKILENTKVGEVTHEDGSKQDISAKEALNVAKTLTRSKDERLEAILKEEDNVFHQLARFAFGIFYGFLMAFLVEIAVLIFWPPIKSIFFGEESFIFTFLWQGFRKANELLK